MFEDEATLLRVDSALKTVNVYTRRYFWPSVNKYRSICADAEECPISEDIASRILCLPLYRTLAGDEVRMIAENVKEVLG
jgi:dTDP-4-amino-4,6-dideoxygalactose transaminase